MFTFKPYRRALRWPLELHGAQMAERMGIIIRLQNAQGQWSYAEVSPLPSFGTETMQEALLACEALAQGAHVASLPLLPALRAGMSMASFGGMDAQPAAGTVALGALVREAADVAAAVAKGCRTFKFKIGRRPMHEEFDQYCRIVEALPAGGRLRLDVNGCWRAAEALFWADRVNACVVEFIEQPFGVKDLPTHRKFLEDAPVPIALDESVSTAEHALRIADMGWAGLWIIKPALWGYWATFLEFRKRFAGKIIYSSALETGIGQRAGIALACSDPQRGEWALGYGVDNLFEDDGLDACSTAEAIWSAL